MDELRINVAQLLKSPVGTVRRYEIEGKVDICGNGAASDARGDVELVRTDQSILVRANVTTSVEIDCSRCLTMFRAPLVLNIEEEYFPTVNIVSGGPMSVPSDPGGFVIDERHTLDLIEAIRQYALVGTPMKPLCRPDCRGLCPGFGAKLNAGACRCPAEAHTLPARSPEDR